MSKGKEVVASVEEILARVKAEADARQFALDTQWWDACKAVARGEPVDPQQIAQLIMSLGRTGDQFSKDTARIARRIDIAAKYKASPEQLKKRADLARQITKLRQDKAAAIEEFENAERPLVVEMDEIDNTNEEPLWFNELINGCPYPPIVKRWNANELRRGHLANEETRLLKLRQVAARDPNYKKLRNPASGATYPDPDWVAEIDQAKKQLPDIEKRLAKLASESAEVLAERDRLMKLMLEP